MVMVPLFNRNQGQVAAAQAERTGARRVGKRRSWRRVRRSPRRRRATRMRSGPWPCIPAVSRTLARQNLDVVRPDVRSRPCDGLRRPDGAAPVPGSRAGVHNRVTRGLGGARRPEARAGRDEMTADSHISCVGRSSLHRPSCCLRWGPERPIRLALDQPGETGLRSAARGRRHPARSSTASSEPPPAVAWIGATARCRRHAHQ